MTLTSGSKICRAAPIAIMTMTLMAMGGNSVAAAEPVIALRSAPLLFADDGGVARRVHISRTVHAARTRREPVLVADQPWEHLRVYMWGTVHHDPDSGKFAMWYMSRPPPPLTGTRNLYAVSDDGLRWTKPALGVFEFNGSKQNNLLGVGGGSLAVIHDPLDDVEQAQRVRFLERP